MPLLMQGNTRNMIDLSIPEHSYFFGFMQADGHLRQLTRNRGSASIELKCIDKILLEKFAKLFPVHSSLTYRTRKTNFNNIETACWRVYNFQFRSKLKLLGMPVGKKSDIISLPNFDFVSKDYFRGLIDGDGSLGLTRQGLPFLSFITKSENLKNGYLEWLSQETNKPLKNVNRNKRDNAYNIFLSKEDAQIIASSLYYENCLCLERKYQKSLEVKNWIRPTEMKKR